MFALIRLTLMGIGLIRTLEWVDQKQKEKRHTFATSVSSLRPRLPSKRTKKKAARRKTK